MRYDEMELIEVNNNTALLNKDIAAVIADFEDRIKDLKAKEDKLKALILAEMEAKNIVKVDNEYLTISYVASTDRETLDSKKLRAELPDIYDEYVKISPVKSSIRIKVK